MEKCMPANEYHFITHWQVEGTAEQVAEILGDATDLPRWWPSVYLDVQQVRPSNEDGTGGAYDLFTKGWLPYTLRWQMAITASNPPHGFALTATGDFEGRGIWTFAQNGPNVAITYDWKLAAEKPLLRRFSFLMKPIFAANHRWAMRMGEESLALELRRRFASTEAERTVVPDPPGPTSVPKLPLLAVAAVGAAAGTLVVRRVRRG
jgi:hypothetical protein